ncbi:MAG: hypothetical protein ACKPEY_02680, partial [Planctomycetota bacterium]
RAKVSRRKNMPTNPYRVAGASVQRVCTNSLPGVIGASALTQPESLERSTDFPQATQIAIGTWRFAWESEAT